MFGCAGALASVLLTPKVLNKQKGEADPHDRMLSAEEAASILRRKRRWIYRNAHRLPFVRRLSARSMLHSKQGIERYLASRRYGRYGKSGI